MKVVLRSIEYEDIVKHDSDGYQAELIRGQRKDKKIRTFGTLVA